MVIFLWDLFLWWKNILRQIFSIPFESKTSRAGRHLVYVCADGIRFGKECLFPSAEVFALVDFESQLRKLKSKQKLRSETISLRIDRERAVVRKLTNIALPASRHRAAALLDIEASTPFSLGDLHVLTLQIPESGDAAKSSYAIVKRSILDPVIEAFRKTGTTPARIEISDGARLHVVSFNDQRQIFESMPDNRISIAAILACCLAAMVTLAHLTLQYDDATRQVEVGVEKLNAEAKIVRGEIDQRAARIAEIQALRKSIEERKLVSTIWEELAKVLPDSSFLTDLAIKDNKVSINGYSAAASSIIVTLEGSDLFEQASFTAPVVKVPGNSGDRFAIDLTMSGQ